jgi:hypothetical protein
MSIAFEQRLPGLSYLQWMRPPSGIRPVLIGPTPAEPGTIHAGQYGGHALTTNAMLTGNLGKTPAFPPAGHHGQQAVQTGGICQRPLSIRIAL